MINEIWAFLKNPAYTPYSNMEKAEKWVIFKRILILNIGASFILGLIMGLITTAIGADLGDHGVGAMFDKLNVFVIFFLAVILAPILEETIFRAPLVFFKNSNYFKLAFYISILLFGIVHLSNFENFLDYLWLAPILVAPQTFAGIFLGFTRVKLGLEWSMFLHAAHNAILLSPMLFLKFAGETI